MKKKLILYSNGDKYEGELKGKKKHGYGIFTWADGSTFTGDWKNDKKHGHATFVEANGETLSGYWKNGKFDQIAGPRTDQRIDLKYLQKSLNLKKLLKFLNKKNKNIEFINDLRIYYDFLEACSTKINTHDKLFDEINSHEQKLYERFRDSFITGRFLPLVSENFKLEKVKSVYGKVLTEYKQHSYTHQLIYSKSNKIYYVLLYRGYDNTNDGYACIENFKDKKLALDFIIKDQARGLKEIKDIEEKIKG